MIASLTGELARVQEDRVHLRVGPMTAELMIAELAGKVDGFAAGVSSAAPMSPRTSEDEAAIAILSGPQMGLRRAEAEALLHRAKQANPQAIRAEQLVPEMLKLHSQR